MEIKSTITVCEGNVKYLIAKLLLGIIENLWYEARVNKQNKVVFDRHKGESLARRFMDEINVPSAEKEHYYILASEICDIMQSEQLHRDVMTLLLVITGEVFEKINFISKHEKGSVN